MAGREILRGEGCGLDCAGDDLEICLQIGVPPPEQAALLEVDSKCVEREEI